jgi:hypothetical protein
MKMLEPAGECAGDSTAAAEIAEECWGFYRRAPANSPECHG